VIAAHIMAHSGKERSKRAISEAWLLTGIPGSQFSTSRITHWPGENALQFSFQLKLAGKIP